MILVRLTVEIAQAAGDGRDYAMGRMQPGLVREFEQTILVDIARVSDSQGPWEGLFFLLESKLIPAFPEILRRMKNDENFRQTLRERGERV